MIALKSSPFKSVYFQFGEMNIVRDCVQGLTHVQIEDISDSSLVHLCTYTIPEGL